MLLADAAEAGATPPVEGLRKMLATASACRAGSTGCRCASCSKRCPVLRDGEASDRAGPYRILMVDDHESNRDLLSRRLAREGHEVFTAGSGEAALRLAGSQLLDPVLLDPLVPGMSGYEVLARLKADPQRGHPPVIMISALDELDSAARCLELGPPRTTCPSPATRGCCGRGSRAAWSASGRATASRRSWSSCASRRRVETYQLTGRRP